MSTEIRIPLLPVAALVLGLAAGPAVAGSDTAAPQGDPWASLTPPGADEGAPAVADDEALAPEGAAAAPPPAGEGAEASVGEGTAETAPPAPGSAEAPVVLEGPLRPKGTLPSAAAPKDGEDQWRRSFEGGVKWKKGDTAVTVSGAPFSGFRIGGSISR